MRVNNSDIILNNMLKSFEGTCIEGDLVYTLFSAVSKALEKEYLLRDEQDKAFLLSDAKGYVLDEQISWFGIERLAGTVSKGIVIINGNTDGKIGRELEIVDAKGSIFTIGEVLSEPPRDYVPDPDELNPPVFVNVYSNNVGIENNLDSGTVFSTDYFDYDSIMSYTQLTGATNNESDEDFLARFLYIQKNRGNAGNPKHYVEWSLSVDGVGDCKVYPLKRGAGTVDILITDGSGQPCNAEVVEKCQAYIDEQKPVGCNALVKTATVERITITGTFELFNKELEQQTKEELDKNITQMVADLMKLNVKSVYLSKLVGVIESYPNVIKATINEDSSKLIQLSDEKVYDIVLNITVAE